MCCNPNKTYEYPKIQEKLREDLQQHGLVKRRVEHSEVAPEGVANTDMKKHSVAPENSLAADTALAGFATAGLESVDLASAALVDMTPAESVLPDMNLAGKEQYLAAGTNTPLPADRELDKNPAAQPEFADQLAEHTAPEPFAPKILRPS